MIMAKIIIVDYSLEIVITIINYDYHIRNVINSAVLPGRENG